MNTSIFFGGSVVAAVVAGAIALFAPCCISAMLPAYFATSFQSSGGPVDAAFQVGKPGPGATAPDFDLASTAGGSLQLNSLRGKTVILYFQEGVDCQPCWDQLKDIERGWSGFQALGIDQIVSITTDPLGALKQKVADEGLTTPVLSDPSLAASRAYDANSYGMMGNGADGHTFVVVGPDGEIRFRADYGGAPNYTMYVKVSTLLAALQHGLQA